MARNVNLRRCNEVAVVVVPMEYRHAIILVSLFRDIPFLEDNKLGCCICSACNDLKDACSS